jgi:glucan phosphoethanolaminetransferase (alkaline phosphatase superfamily)
MILLAIIPVTAQHNGYADWLVPNFWLMFFFISLLTIAVLISLLIVQNKNQEYYAQTFLAATTVKILACLAFIFVFIAKNKVDKTVFMADFFYVYLLNMAFEVYILLRNLRHKNLR